MWQRTVWSRSPPSSAMMSSTRPPCRNQAGRCTMIGSLVRACASAAPRSDFLLIRCEIARDADLADEPDLRIGPIDAVQRLVHDLIGDIRLAHRFERRRDARPADNSPSP